MSAYQDGYAAALDAVQRIPSHRRLNGNAFVADLDDLRRREGIEIDPRMGLWVEVRDKR